MARRWKPRLPGGCWHHYGQPDRTGARPCCVQTARELMHAGGWREPVVESNRSPPLTTEESIVCAPISIWLISRKWSSSCSSGATSFLCNVTPPQCCEAGRFFSLFLPFLSILNVKMVGTAIVGSRFTCFYLLQWEAKVVILPLVIVKDRTLIVMVYLVSPPCHGILQAI